MSEDGGEILAKTETFAASTAEIDYIVGGILDWSYSEGSELDWSYSEGSELDWSYSEGSGVVLGGVTYKVVRAGRGLLVAEDGGKGVIFRLSGDKWIIGVYGRNLNRYAAYDEIDYIVSSSF